MKLESLGGEGRSLNMCTGTGVWVQTRKDYGAPLKLEGSVTSEGGSVPAGVVKSPRFLSKQLHLLWGMEGG